MKPFCLILTLGLGLVITDCSTGTRSYKRATLTGKIYSPESTILIWNGEDFNEVEVPESWTLNYEDKEGRTWPVSVDKRCYDLATNGHESIVKISKGWSGFVYSSTLSPETTPDEELSIEK